MFKKKSLHQVKFLSEVQSHSMPHFIVENVSESEGKWKLELRGDRDLC